MKRVVVSICLLLTALQFGHAQDQKADSIRLEKALTKAYKTNDAERAAIYFAQAKEDITTPYWRCRYNNAIGTWLGNHQMYDSAAFYFRRNIEALIDEGQSDEYYKEMSHSFYGLSRTNDDIKDRTGMIALNKRGIELLENRHIIDRVTTLHLIEIGNNHWFMENYAIALEWFEKTMAYAREHNIESAITNASFQLAQAYQHQRKLKLSLEYFKFHLRQTEKTRRSLPSPYVLDLKSIGLIYAESNRLDSAVYYFEKGLEFVKTGALDDFQKGLGPLMKNLILNNLANVQMRLKDYEGAEASFLGVLAFDEGFRGKTSPYLIRTLKGLGDLHRRTKEFDLCEAYYQRALSLAKVNNYDIHSCYNRLGYMFGVTKEYDKSVAYYDSTIVLNSKTYNNDEMAYVYPVHLFNALMGKALAANSREHVEVQEIEDIYVQLKDIVSFFQENTDSRAIFGYIPKVLGYLYDAYSKTYDITGNDLWLERMWEISELNKAAKLRKQLKANYSLTYAVPDELLQREKSLKDSINQLISKLKPGGFDSTLFELKRKHENLIQVLENDHPKYHALKNSTRFISLSEKQAGLQSGELLYSFLEGDNTVFVMQISNDSIKKAKASKHELSGWIADHNNAIFKALDDSLYLASEKLTEALLLKPEDLKGVERLVIVPDGLIWNLNFAGLTYLVNGELAFIGKNKMISFDHFSSESSLFQQSVSNKVLAFSYNEESDATLTGDRTALRNLDTSLPGTSLEVTSISKQWKGDYFFAKGANETNFKEEVGKYGILHLAIHGYQDEVNPENSYLKFATADSLNDGKLHAYEVYNLNLNADLAVLTACHSGQGTFVAGEGMVSLGKAFSYAGVKSVLISRWEVSDYSAPFLMQYFYAGLKEGMHKSEALKYAQTKYLENHSDALTASPFYWSSFYILGDDSPIYTSAAINPWMLLWLAVVLLSTQIFLRKGKANL